MKTVKKLLVTRTDRLGDVLLSLPALSLLREALPQTRIDFLCKSSYLEILKPVLKELGLEGVSFEEKSLVDWKNWFQTRKYDAALFLFTERGLFFSAWAAKIPLRVGIYSKPWSILTLNAGLWQRRSRAEKNESLYNVELAQKLITEVAGRPALWNPKKVTLKADPTAAGEAARLLEAAGIDSEKPFVVVHPGMGGSALNLSPRQYVSLIEAIEKKRKLSVVITMGPAAQDESVLADMLKKNPKLRVVKGMDLRVLKEVFRFAKTVIGPSTGPLHLAHLVGVSTIGLYSPVRSHRAERWAPTGGTGKVSVLFPRLPCPGQADCVGTRCRDFFCMDQMPWNELVLEKLEKSL